MSHRTMRMPALEPRHRIIKRTRGRAATRERYLQHGSTIRTPSRYTPITAILLSRQPLILVLETRRRAEAIRGFSSRKRHAAWKAGSRDGFLAAGWSGKHRAST